MLYYMDNAVQNTAFSTSVDVPLKVKEVKQNHEVKVDVYNHLSNHSIQSSLLCQILRPWARLWSCDTRFFCCLTFLINWASNVAYYIKALSYWDTLYFLYLSLCLCLGLYKDVQDKKDWHLYLSLCYMLTVIATFQFSRIHTSSLINIEKILNRPITKFYNSDDVNLIAVELRLTKTRSTSFHKKHNLL